MMFLTASFTILWLTVIKIEGRPITYQLDSKCLTKQCQQAAHRILAAMNLEADPCEDFYEFACGNFNTSQPLPAGKPLWDNFQILTNATEFIVREILESPICNEESEPKAVSKARMMYASCMDSDLQDAVGMSALEKVLKEWGGWPVLDLDWEQDGGVNWRRIGDLVAEYGITLLFDISVLPNMLNANQTAIYIQKPVLGYPAPLYEIEEPCLNLKEHRAVEDMPFTRYLAHIATILRYSIKPSHPPNDTEILQSSVDTVRFMQKLAAVSSSSRADLLSNKNRDLNGLVLTVEELQQWTEEALGNKTLINWLEFLSRAFAKSAANITLNTEVLVADREVLRKILIIAEEAEAKVLGNFIMARLMMFLSPEAGGEMREAALQYYQQMKYIPEDYPRWNYCVHKVMDYPKVGLSHAVAYVHRHIYFHFGKFEKAGEMVTNLQQAFKQLLAENKWMDDDTRKIAMHKTDAMLVLLGYPSWFTESSNLDKFYDQLEIHRNDHFGNVARLRSFVQAINMANINNNRDRNEWTQSSLTVNAFYNGLNNRITFPAGIMEEPFFTGSETMRALDYGRIGAIVGHEITHGYDSSGRLYDEMGTASNWWTDATAAAFSERAQCFIEQYSSYKIPELNVTVDGSRTLAENIADNGGLRAALRALEVDHTPRLPSFETLTPKQLFFLGYASMWCRVDTRSSLQSAVKNDVHSPNRFRVIGSLSNMPEFSSAFNCPNGSKMNPIKKCMLW